MGFCPGFSNRVKIPYISVGVPPGYSKYSESLRLPEKFVVRSGAALKRSDEMGPGPGGGGEEVREMGKRTG